MLIHRIVREAGGFGPFRSLDGARVAHGTLGGQSVLAVLPSSFMNLSGRCVGSLARRYGLTSPSVCVLHDDLDLAIGRNKVKRGGSSGGHRGIDSCAACLGDANFWRLRIGIGRPPDKSQVCDFVLEPFRAEEAKALAKSFDAWVAHADALPAALADPAALSRLLNAVAGGSAGGGPAGGDGSSGGGSGQTKGRPNKSRLSGASEAVAAAPTEGEAAAKKGCKAPKPTEAAREQSYGATSLAAALAEAGGSEAPRDAEREPPMAKKAKSGDDSSAIPDVQGESSAAEQEKV